MKNIHILPTDQPSRLWIDTITGKLVLDKEPNALHSQHIYITSDEEIKKGDWYLDTFKNEIRKAQLNLSNDKYKKIILTTDPTLIADGVQSIDNEFLEWFVKNPTCEFVEVELEPLFPMYRTFIEDIDTPPFYGNLKRKIIIPQEEPKQEKEEEWKELEDAKLCEPLKSWDEPKQETLEEAAEKRIPTGTHIWELTETRRCDFIVGANYQAERMFSEEDMSKSFFQGWVTRERFDDQIPNIIYPQGLDYEEKQEYAFNLWFEQFKKK